MISRYHPVVAAVSSCYSEPKGRFPRVTHPCATITRRQSFDLHVLGMPPAFVLSQDQTLKFDARFPTRWNNPAENRSLQGANSCTSHILSGYVTRHTNWLKLLRSPRTLNAQVTAKPPPACPFISITMSKSPTTNTGASPAPKPFGLETQRASISMPVPQTPKPP